MASSINKDRARLEEARSKFVRVLDVYRRKLPPDDPKITVAMAGVAWTLGSQKRYAESLVAFKELLTIDRRYRGAEDIDVAYALRGMAEVLDWSGRPRRRPRPTRNATDLHPGAGPRILRGLPTHG